MAKNLDLIWPIKERNLNRVNEFINLGVNVNTFFHGNMSPLVYTLLNMNLSETGTIDDIISRLIDAGADVNSRNERTGMTATMLAMVKHRSDEILLRFIKAGADVNLLCKEGKTMLIYAIIDNYGETVIRALIDRGSDVNTGPTQLKPLYCAAFIRNDPNTTEMLLLEGADFNHQSCPQPFLPLCCRERCRVDDNCRFKRVTDILIRRGFNIEQRHYDGNTVIHLTSCNYVISLGLRNRISVDEMNHNGFTPLLQSLLFHNGYKVNDLLLLGADPNWRDSRGKGYLHYSTLIQIEIYIDLLLYHGADLLVTNNSGQTPIDFGFTVRRLFRRWSLLGLKSLIQHFLLYINEEGLNELVQGLDEPRRRQEISQYIDMCRSEIRDMNDTLLKEGVSIYQFCHSKRYYSSGCIPIHIDEYLIDHDNISANYRIYKHIICLRLKDNSRKNFKSFLQETLEDIKVKATSTVDGREVNLYYHCLYLVAKKYLNYRHLYALIASSFDH